MIKGLDNGYLYTKDDQKRIFKSAYSLSDESLTGENKITINGTDYYYGIGATTALPNKINDDLNMVCTLANLCLTGPGSYNLVVGLPIVQFRRYKEEFREKILSYNNCEIIFAGKNPKIRINDVKVLAQGAAALYSSIQADECIIIDIGSITINIAQFEFNNGKIKLVKSDTFFNGVLHLYEKIISAVNSAYDLNLDSKYAEKILLGDFRVEGDDIDCSLVYDILIDYLKPIFTRFRSTYPYKIYPIFLCGGGSEVLFDVFYNNFKNASLIPDAQYANAIGYYKYGCLVWG